MSRPGLQPERTDLARHRTALAAAACALLLLDVAARHDFAPTTLLPAVLAAGVALTLAVLARQRSATRPIPLALSGVMLTAACMAALPLAI